MKIFDKKKFIVVALNADDKIFVVHVTALAELRIMPIYPFCQTQVTLLTSEKNGISTEYFDFYNVFYSNSAVELLEYPGILNHFIDLLDDKQPPYSPIYSLGPIKLKTLKTYIKANLVSSSINKLIATSPFIDLALLIVKHTFLPNVNSKRKHINLMVACKKRQSINLPLTNQP